MGLFKPINLCRKWDELTDEQRELFFHVMSVGGGADVDEDGNECGHDGAAIGGMEINQNKYLFNGRRLGKAPK